MSQPRQGEPEPISVAIIEDQPDIREGLGVLIRGTPGYRFTGSFRSMEEALANIGKDLPDVALVDFGLLGMSGIEGTRRLRERHPALLVMMLTIYGDDERIFEAMCAGACGYLLKKTPPARMLKASVKWWQEGRPCRQKWRDGWCNCSRSFIPLNRRTIDCLPPNCVSSSCWLKDIITRRPPRKCKSAST